MTSEMMATMERSGVDTIYLLSDGAPSRGGGVADIEQHVGLIAPVFGWRYLTFVGFFRSHSEVSQPSPTSVSVPAPHSGNGATGASVPLKQKLRP